MNAKVASQIHALTLKYKKAVEREDVKGIAVTSHSLISYLQALLDTDTITERQFKDYIDAATGRNTL